MFESPLSFEGRIRRSEYGLSTIIYAILSGIVNVIISESGGDAAALMIAYIPLLWFLIAQSCKRCHDIGNSGWWQLIPFYGFWLLFQDGQHGPNQYGDNPKSVSNNQYKPNYTSPPSKNITSTGYSGGYNGGHNNQSSPSPSQSKVNHDNESGYKNGDLYN